MYCCLLAFGITEWQKAIYSAGGPEIKKWPIQLRRSAPSGLATSSNGSSLQNQDLSLIQERTSSTSTLYSSHGKPSTFVKGSMGQSTGRKQIMGGQSIAGSPRGLFQWVYSISFTSISLDHSMHFVLPAELVSPGQFSDLFSFVLLSSLIYMYRVINFKLP